MSTAVPQARVERQLPSHHLTLFRVARSEGIKVLTLRSSLACYLMIGALLVPVMLLHLTLPQSRSTSSMGAQDAALTGLLLLELLVGITATLASSGEYSSGAARSTFAVVPRRGLVLAAKLMVHSGLVLVLAAAALAAALIAGVLGYPGMIGPLGDAELIRAVAGTAVTLTGVSVFGVTLGLLTRTAAGGIGGVFVLMFLPVIVVVAPAVTAFVPGRLAEALVFADRPPEAHFLALWPAALVFAGWVAVAVAAAAVVLRRRDV